MKGYRIIPLLVALAALSCQAQDYDYESAPVPRRPAPSRIQPGYSGPAQPKPTPVAILKQINRHNEDGSYTYGYEGGDGSFKIETKLPTGEVKGKYGYVDDSGKLKVVEYGANKYGFQPAGEGITVPPPTLVDETIRKDGLQSQEFDDGQYYQPAPQIRAQPVQAAPRPRPRPVARPPPPPQYEDYSDSPSPAPQRPLQIPGAIPSGVVYSEQPRSITRPSHQQSFQLPQRSFAPSPPPQRFTQPKFVNAPASAPLRSFASYIEPAPVKQNLDDITYARPVPQQQSPQYAPAPHHRPAPQPQPIQYSAPRQAQRESGGGILDQLAKDYALPSGGSPALHDISFGYY